MTRRDTLPADPAWIVTVDRYVTAPPLVVWEVVTDL